MLTAQAQVQTERSSRYLVQLCRHAAAMGDTRGHWKHVGDSMAGHEVQLHAEWSDTHGTLVFAPVGRCTLQASSDALLLCIEATDEDNLRRSQEVITRNLERFGRRDHLTVTWRQGGEPAARPVDTDPRKEPRTVPAAHAAPTYRGHHTTMVLATAGVLGIALAMVVHLGLGTAVLGTSRWWGWTAVGLVVPVAVILGHVVVPMAVFGVRKLATRRNILFASRALRVKD